MNQNRIYLLVLLCTMIFGPLWANTGKYRITLRDDPATTAVIGWDQESGSNPVVYYGPVDHERNWSSYAFNKSADRVVAYREMNNHFARLTGLQPNTAYYFVIRDSQGVSERYWFKTAPNNPDERLSFIAGGDSRNNRTPRINANKLVAKLRPHAVLFGGDMTSQGTVSEWQQWFDDWQYTISEDNRIFPIIAARGNHEASNEMINNLFDTPSSNVYYGLTFGNNLIRTYTLNTQVSISGDQTDWLRGDLANNDHVIWKMAQYHRPMRPHTATKNDGNNQYENWASLFYEKNVRLVIECDAHVVKTTWPVKPSIDSGSDEGFIRDDESGTIYAGEGCWGAPIRANNDDKEWTRNSGSFNQFKWIFVDKTKIETRTIIVDNADNVESVSDNARFTPPVNLDIWDPSNGSVVTITNNGSIPMVAITSPANNTYYSEPQSVTIQANATDNDGSISKVEFFVNSGSIGVDNTAPYAVNYTVPFDGSYTLTAVATDNDGNTGSALPVYINAGVISEARSWQVSSGNDDVEENGVDGSMYMNSSDLELVYDGSSRENQTVGMLFRNIDIPQGAIVTKAYIQFTVDEANSGATTLTVNGEASNNAQDFSTSSFDVSSRAMTSASVNWSPAAWSSAGAAGAEQRTPDISSVVQEIVSRGGWISGNNLMLAITGSGERTAEAYEGSAGNAPKLFVEFTVGEPEEGCYTASPNIWHNVALPEAQDGIFTAEADVTPSSLGAASALSLSASGTSSWGDLAATVLFADASEPSLENTIVVRDGGGYRADEMLNYEAGVSYHVRMEVDVPNHTYSVFVTPAGSSEVALASGYAFRSSQASADTLTTWTVGTGVASFQACDLSTGLDADPNCHVATSDSWQNVPLSEAASGIVVAEAEVIPSGLGAASALSLSSTATTSWSGLAATVLFADASEPAYENTIVVRDGDDYSADQVLAYEAGKRYQVRMVVNVPDHKYSVFVTPAGGAEVALATDYDFRSSQAAITSLTQWSVSTGVTDFTACNLSSTTSEPYCLTGAPADWQNLGFTAQNGALIAEADVTPLQAEAAAGISLSAASTDSVWSQLAATVLFSDQASFPNLPVNSVLARNGGSYMSVNSLVYEPNKTYHVRFEVNVVAHTYSAYVTPEGGSEVTIADGYSFRTGQQGVSALSNWNISAGMGAMEACNFTVEETDLPPPISDEVDILGNWETGDHSQWDALLVRDEATQFEVVDGSEMPYPVRQGNYSARFTVNPGDNWGGKSGERSEVELFAYDREQPGDEYYYAWSTLFPENWVEPARWGIVLQWHAHTTISPPIGINAKANSLSLDFCSGNIDNAYPCEKDDKFPLLTDLNKGKWNDFIIRIKFAADNTGFVQVWHRLEGQSEFQMIFEQFNYPTLQWARDIGRIEAPKWAIETTVNGVDGYTTGAYLHHGFYRGIGNMTNTVYQDAFCRGTTYDAVLSCFSDAAGSQTVRKGVEDDLQNREAQEASKSSLKAYPNPFSGETSVSYKLERGSDVHMALYTLEGTKVKDLYSGSKSAGTHTYRLDANEYQLEKGIYLLQLVTEGKTLVERIVYLKD